MFFNEKLTRLLITSHTHTYTHAYTPQCNKYIEVQERIGLLITFNGATLEAAEQTSLLGVAGWYQGTTKRKAFKTLFSKLGLDLALSRLH